MSYTYLPSTPFSPRPTIIMTTLPSSQKTSNLLCNPRVSLLVHDWSSHRTPTLGTADLMSTSPERGSGTSALARLLYNLNSASLSRISVNINGMARVLEEGSDEEQWYRARHKEHNHLQMAQGPSFDQQNGASEGAGAYIEAEEGRTVVVDIHDGRISDVKGAIRDFVVGESATTAAVPIPNGV
jgi:hypothetical protein